MATNNNVSSTVRVAAAQHSVNPPSTSRPTGTRVNKSYRSATGGNVPCSPPPPLVHSCLSPAQIAKAHAAFLGYCESDSAQRAASSPLSTTAQPVMSAKSVQVFLGDLGIIKTESEAKDVIFTLNQSAAIAHRNKKIDERACLSSGGGGSVMSGRTTTSTADEEANHAAGGRHANSQTLSFPLFVELLTTTFTSTAGGGMDSSREAELHQAFQSLDTNGDGVLSSSDVRTLVGSLLVDNPSNSDLRALEKMTAEQLSSAIAEADIDGDGRVTLEDFIRILTTA